MLKKIFYAAAFVQLISCGNATQDESDSENPHAVTAAFETEESNSVEGEDAADDPAVWYNRANPSASLILGTNKKLGLEVYNLDGKRLATYPTGRLNNVDVRPDFRFRGQLVDVAAASNRTRNGLDVWVIDPSGTQFELVSDTTFVSELDEVYGLCMYTHPADSSVHVMVNGKNGIVEQYQLIDSDSLITFQLVQKYVANGQVEGMVTDEELGLLYVGEEDGGIYVYSIGSDAPRVRVPQSGEENPDLKYDIEGLTLYINEDGSGYLISSSQGNNRYAVYDRHTHAYIGYFEVVESNGIDGVEETDGIDVIAKNLGPNFPHGFFICQDGFNNHDGKAVPQNFKVVKWEEVLELMTFKGF